MQKLARAALAVLTGLAVASCAAPTRPAHVLAPPDAAQPASGACHLVGPGDIATFTLSTDTPDPRCGKVLAGQRVQLVNATPSRITVTWDGMDYELEPGVGKTFEPAFGVIWEPGVHQLHTSLYGGGGPEIWLVEG